MTRAMRAVRPVRPVATTHHALRVALVRDGAIVHERLFERAVWIGTDPSCDVLLDEGPARHRLFEHHRGTYTLAPWPGLGGRVASGVTTEPRRMRLELDARGTLAVGGTRLLFHVLPAPPAQTRAALPPNVEERPFQGVDWLTTVVAAFSFLLHFFAVGLVYSDWLDPIVDEHAVMTQLVETSKRALAPPAIDQPVATPAEASTQEAESDEKKPGTSKGQESARAGAGQSPHAGSGEHRGDARAAELGEALDALGIQTMTALDRAGLATSEVLDGSDVPVAALDEAARSRRGAEERDDLKLSDGRQSERFRPGEDGPRRGPTSTKRRGGDADTAGEEKKVKGPEAGASAGGGDTSEGGKNIPGASAVVARMRASFRGCYRAGLAGDPTLEGSTSLVARVAANGSVSSVGGGGGKLAPIVPCLTAVVRGAQFAAPRDGSGVVAITVNFWRIE